MRSMKIVPLFTAGFFVLALPMANSTAQPKCAAKPTAAQRQLMPQARAVDPVAIPGSSFTVQRVVYKDVSFFDVGCDTPNGSGLAAIEDFAQLAQGMGSFSHILVVGHADSGGDPFGERQRTERRAEAGINVLRRLGLRATFLTAGRGYDQPVRLNIGQEDKAVNRRLEFFVGASPQAVRIAAGLESALEGRRTRPILPSLLSTDPSNLPTIVLGALRGAGLLR